MGVSYGVGTRVFVPQAFLALPSPTPPHYHPPPIHLSCSNHLGSCHLIQLITNRLGLWETRRDGGLVPSTPSLRGALSSETPASTARPSDLHWRICPEFGSGLAAFGSPVQPGEGWGERMERSEAEPGVVGRSVSQAASRLLWQLSCLE